MMNEVAMMDTNQAVERTPELIAIEINSIKEQSRKILLFNSIEIGRRLTEAKAMLNHGQWSEWLEKSVDYSQRTASNLMRIFEEYGSSQIAMFCDNAKSQALANLSYTRAVALLGIPMNEREKFIQDHDLEAMSTRELQQAIKEKQELEAKVRELEVGWEGSKRVAQKDIERLNLAISDLEKQIAEAQGAEDNDEVDRLKESLKIANNSLASSLKKIKVLEDKLKEPIEVTAAPVVEKIPEEVERELYELREKAKKLEVLKNKELGGNTATISFSVHFDLLVKEFRDLLGTLSEINDINTATCEKYKKAVRGLIKKMLERL